MGKLTRNPRMILLMTVFIGVIIGCRSTNPTPSEPAVGSNNSGQRILVVPFQDMAAAFGIDQTVQGPLSGKIFVTGRVALPAAKKMTTETTRLVSKRMNVDTLIPSWEEVRSLGISPWSRPRPQLIADLQRIGRLHGADTVMIGFVYEYVERVGGDYGVETPAGVGFELNVVRVRDGRLIWHDRCIETQQTLSDNLLNIGKFFKRKGRWVTAEEMAAQALDKMVAEAFAF